MTVRDRVAGQLMNIVKSTLVFYDAADVLAGVGDFIEAFEREYFPDDDNGGFDDNDSRPNQ